MHFNFFVLKREQYSEIQNLLPPFKNTSYSCLASFDDDCTCTAATEGRDTFRDILSADPTQKSRHYFHFAANTMRKFSYRKLKNQI